MSMSQPCPASGRHACLVANRGRIILLASLLLSGTPASAAEGDPEQGAHAFRACAACHSLQAGRHRTGPSLAGIVGREAGSAEGFRRYSPALEGSGVVWDEAALDAWLDDPQAFIPGNRMAFRGLPDARVRADLIAYLTRAEHQDTAAGEGGMAGMDAADPPDLETLGPEHRVTSIRHCGDTYEVTTGDGETLPFWEFNLRFKTDGGELGPEPGKPALVGAGMAGDRASVVFASPGEISASIAPGC